MIEVPELIQRRAWERAYALVNDYADRLSLEQHVRMYVIQMVDPDRLGWAEVAEAVGTWAMVTEVRV